MASVSQHHLEGFLADANLDRILASCRRQLVTGIIRITAGPKVGTIELRAGGVDRSSYGGLEGRAALAEMQKLSDGEYEIEQQLPDLTGGLGGSATAEGDVGGVPLIAIMRYCEDNALTCTIAVTSGDDRGQIDYRAGEIKRVEMNGTVDEDAIVTLLAWTSARYRVSAPPLDLDVEGWPQMRAQSSTPFSLSTSAERAA